MGLYDQKVVVITGASSGIGEHLARRYYAQGASIAVCSRSQQRIDRAVSAFAAPGDKRVLALKADMTDRCDITCFMQEVLRRFSRVDILINNAGLSRPKPSIDVLGMDWDVTVNTKFQGYFFMSQFAAQDMMRRGQDGSILQIGSVQSATVIPGQAVYASVNAGIVQMTRSLAREWGKAGIRVNCIAPGSIHTPENAARYADPAVENAMCEKIPLGYRGYVEQIADAAFFLTGEASSYITGQTLYVDGGLSLVQG